MLTILPAGGSALQESSDLFGPGVDAAAAIVPLSTLGPLAMHTFGVLGLLGMAAHHAEFTALPSSLSFLAYPPVWTLLLALEVLLVAGSLLKVTKPVAQVLSLPKVAAAVMALIAMLSPILQGGGAEVREAGGVGALLLFGGALSVLMAIMVVRLALDLLAWISPLPFIDALLEFAKLFLTLATVALAIYAPVLAIIVNVAIVAAAVLLARLVLRMLRFVLRILWDTLAGRVRPASVTVGRDGIGPMSGFVIRDAFGLPNLTSVSLSWDRERGWLAVHERKGTFELGGSGDVRLGRGLLCTAIRSNDATLVIPARYHRDIVAVASMTGTPMGGLHDRRGTASAVASPAR